MNLTSLSLQELPSENNVFRGLERKRRENGIKVLSPYMFPNFGEPKTAAKSCHYVGFTARVGVSELPTKTTAVDCSGWLTVVSK